MTDKAWNHDGPAYRGSTKHKRRPGDEVKGTYCPEWTHVNSAGERLLDPHAYDWKTTTAVALFAESLPHPDGGERRFATRDGIAFEAKPSNDGTWHGFPIPWESVPTELYKKWQSAGKVKKWQVKRYWKDNERIDWALETDQ